MEKLYRITPVDKKSIYIVYDAYKELEDGTIRGFTVTELYRWGHGYREFDDPPPVNTQSIIVDPRLGPGNDLDDNISVEFDYQGEWTEEEKEALEQRWSDGDPEDEWGRCNAAWLYDYSDWSIEDEYVEILGPFKVDIVDEDGTVIEENIDLTAIERPTVDPSAWPWGGDTK